MEVIQRVRVACPRCQAPVAGDFKFCPTCAYRLKAGSNTEVLPEAGPRSIASVVLFVAGVLFVGVIAGVGFWLFREPKSPQPATSPGGRGEVLPPEELHASTVRRYMRQIPRGTAYWVKSSIDGTSRPMQVEPIEILLYEVPCGFYAEFVGEQWARLADGAAPGPTLRRLWEPGTAEERQQARDYFDHWVTTFLDVATPADAVPRIPTYLLDFVPAAQRKEAAQSVEALTEAFPVPWPRPVALLLLAPPNWVYENAWEELRWRLPLNTDALPVTNVSWIDAVAFCEWLTERVGGEQVFRLPVVGEWMRVAHGNYPPFGPDARDYPWGSALLTQACNNAELYPPGVRPSLHRVSQRYIDTDPAGVSHDGRTVDGVFGMAGNAAEWVHYQGDAERRIGDALLVYVDEQAERELLKGRAYGGSFRSTLLECTVESSRGLQKTERRDDIGFRFVAVSRAR